MGSYLPSWATAFVRGTQERYCMFELGDVASCYYEAKGGEYVLQWVTSAGKSGSMSVPFEVELYAFNFVGVASDSRRSASK